MTQPSVYPLAKKARADKLTAQLDADIVQFFCVGGLAPSKANLPEWKQIFRHAVPSYQPASSSKLEEYHIPSEAAHVRTKQLEYLRTCTNLCITFDGQKIRLPQSVYTIHIISPEHRICFFDGHEASEDSHTGKHLFQMLDEVTRVDLHGGVPYTEHEQLTDNPSSWPTTVCSHLLGQYRKCPCCSQGGPEKVSVDHQHPRPVPPPESTCQGPMCH